MKKKVNARGVKANPLEWRVWLLEAVIWVGLAVYIVSAWWPTRQLLYWGEMQEWLAVGVGELVERNFSPWVLVEWATSLPPGFATVLALSAQVSGSLLTGAHGVMLVAMVGLVGGCYWISRFRQGLLVGLITAFLVGMNPVVVASMGWVSIFLWTSSLWVVAGALWQSQRKTLAVAAMSAGVLSLPSSILLLPAVAGLRWKEGRLEKKPLRILLVPVAVLLGWFFYHNMIAGWWLAADEGARLLPETLSAWVRYVVFVGQTLMLGHLRWLVLVPGILAGWVWWKSGEERLAWQSYYGIIISTGLLLAFWGVKGFFEEEMVLLLLPWLVLAAVEWGNRALRALMKESRESMLIIVAGVVALGWLTQWRPDTRATNEYFFGQRGDLGYQDQILISREMTARLALVHSQAKVYGGMPESAQLTLPELGYVQKPVDFQWCREFGYQENEVQLVVFHPYHVSQVECKNLLDKTEHELLQRFESNGKWVELHRITKTVSEPQSQL